MPDSVVATFSHARVDGGGFIVRNTIARDGTIYCGTDVGSWYKFNEGTGRWTDCATIDRVVYPSFTNNLGWHQVNQGPADLRVAPSNSNRVYWYSSPAGHAVARLVRFYRSDDGGATSYELTNFPTVTNASDVSAMRGNGANRLIPNKIAIDPDNEDVIYIARSSANAATGPVALRSVDGGENFIEINTSDGLPRGTDVGSLFWIDGSSSIVSGAHQRVFCLSPGNGIYESTDAGASWTQISSAITSTATAYAGQGGFDASGNFYVLNRGTGTGNWYVSRYASSTWTNLATHTSSARLAVHPTDTGRFAFVVPDSSIYDVTGADGAVGSISGVFATGLTTVQYTQANMTFLSDTPWQQTAVQDRKIGSGIVTEPNWDVTDDTLWMPIFQGIWKATLTPGSPNVAAWVGYNHGIEELVVNDVLHQSSKPLLAATWDEGGFSWTATAEGLNTPPSARIYTSSPWNNLIRGWKLSANPHNPDLVVSCGYNTNNSSIGGPFCYSEDGGVTWEDYAALPANRNYNASQVVVGGSAATPVILSIPSGSPLDPCLPYRSDDLGATWTLLDVSAFSGADPTPSGSGFSGGIFIYLKNWIADPVLEDVFYAYSFSSDAENWGGLWTSTDAGVSWTRTATQATIAISTSAGYGKTLKAAPGKQGHLFLGTGSNASATHPTGDKFKRSTDGGVTWAEIDSNIREVETFGFGAPKSGSDYPTLYYAGFYSGSFGLYMIDDMTDVSNGTSKILTDPTYGRWPMGLGDISVCMDGNKDLWGQVFIGMTGHGVVSATVSPSVSGSCFGLQF